VHAHKQREKEETCARSLMAVLISSAFARSTSAAKTCLAPKWKMPPVIYIESSDTETALKNINTNSHTCDVQKT
jgi:hypothetical protein